VVARNAGIVIVLMRIGVAVSQMLLVGHLTKRLGEQTVIILGSGLYSTKRYTLGAFADSH